MRELQPGAWYVTSAQIVDGVAITWFTPTRKLIENTPEEIRELWLSIADDFYGYSPPPVATWPVVGYIYRLSKLNKIYPQLVDKLTTSDDYLQEAYPTHDIFQISYTTKKKLTHKIGDMFNSMLLKKEIKY